METTKALELLFYGNTYVPLSTGCDGCHFFNYECAGSAYGGYCPTGDVEDLRDSLTALKILEDERVNGNHFLLARINGMEAEGSHLEMLLEKIKQGGTTAYQLGISRAIQQFKEARDTDDAVIDSIRRDYL